MDENNQYKDESGGWKTQLAQIMAAVAHRITALPEQLMRFVAGAIA